MTRFRPAAGRLLILVSALLAGAAALIAAATPVAAAVAESALSITAQTTCQPDGSTTVAWTVTNGNTTSDATITVVDLLPAGTTVSDIVVGATVPADSGTLTGYQVLPPGQTSAGLAIQAQFGSEKTWTESAEKGIVVEGSCEPLYTVSSNCDGLVFTLTNPATEEEPLTYVLSPSNGSQQVVKVDPDDSTTVTLGGPDGFTVGLSVFKFDKQYTWHRPERCQTPPTTTPTTPPQLPTTGTDVTGFVGAGVALVVVGAAVLFLLRRRRAGSEA